MARQRDWTLRTRATLLARLKDIDDHKSWTEFYGIYSHLIYGVARQRGLTEHEAEDVVIETITSVARHMPTFDYDRKLGSFKSWLLQMARWRIIDQYKKRQRSIVSTGRDGSTLEAVADNNLTTAATGCNLEELWNEEWEKCLLTKATEKARRRLNPKHYQVYDLNIKKEWSANKVAEFLSIPITQVYVAKHRVMDTIKKEIERLRDEII